MALTNGQKTALHRAARMMGAEFTEPMRRTVQWNVGGFYSAADRSASRLGFIAVMACYEERLAARGVLLAKTPGYWAGELAKAGSNDAMLYTLRSLAARLNWTEQGLAGWMTGPHLSNGAVTDLNTAPAYWLRRGIDGLRAMLKRKESE